MNKIFRELPTSTAVFSSLQQPSGETVSIGATGGFLGSSLDVHHPSGGVFTEVAARLEKISDAGRRLSFYHQYASGGTLSGDMCIIHAWYGSYTGDLFEVRLIYVSATTYKVRLVESAGATGVTGATVLTKGTKHRYTVRVTDTSITLYIDNVPAAECSLTGLSLSTRNINVLSIGKFYTDGFAGHSYFSDIGLYTAQTAPSTTAQKLTDVAQGIYERYYVKGGASYRPPGDGDNTVSEGQGYLMLTALKENDQDWFDELEAFNVARLERQNHPTFGTTLDGDGANLMAFAFDPSTNAVTDWTEAPDGDIDRAKALYWAYDLWGDAAYRTKANLIAADLITYDTKVYEGLNYMTSNHFEPGKATGELNPSYFDPQFYYLAQLHTGSYAWDAHTRGSYRATIKSYDASGGLSTTVKLVPDWVALNSSGDLVQSSDNGRDTDTKYDAVRVGWRMGMAYLDYGDAYAKAILKDMYTFWDAEWTANPNVFYMEYNHDGTDNGGAYEKVLSYACNIFCFIAENPADTRIATIYGKITGSYQQHPAGSYWSDNPNTPASDNVSYFNTTVVQLCVYTKEGSFKNRGAWKYLNSRGLF